MRISLKIFLFFSLLNITFFQVSLAQANNENQEKNWLKISTQIEEFYLVVDNDYLNSYHFASGDSILLPIGRHELRMIWRNIDDYVSYIEIRKDQTAVKHVTFTSFKTSPNTSYQIIESQQNVSIQTDPNSSIYIDGQFKGTQYSELFLNPGKYELYIESPEYGSLTKTLSVGYTEYTYIAQYNQNINPIPTYQKLIPGASYLSTRQYTKATVTYLGLIALTGTALYFNSNYNSKADLFEKQSQRYLEANNPQLAIALRLQAQNTLKEMETLNTRITWLTIGAVAWYGITTIDGFRKPKEGYKGAITLRPNLAYHNYSFNPELSVKIKF